MLLVCPCAHTNLFRVHNLVNLLCREMHDYVEPDLAAVFL